MRLPARKLHVISTTICIISIFVGMVLFFLMRVDDSLRLDILPDILEIFFALLAWAMGIMAIGMGMISIVLGLYRSAERDH